MYSFVIRRKSSLGNILPMTLEGRDDMSGWKKLKDSVSSLVDIVMPPVDGSEMLDETEEEQAQAAPRASAAERERTEVREVNGSSYNVSSPAFAPKRGFGGGAARQRTDKPQLTVHTTKTASLKVQIYAPTNFDQVTAIADDIKSGKAAVVNYERIDAAEQRRICDFVNGVCYVLNGCAKRVTDQIVMYVPDGVDVSEAMSIALPY